MWTAVACGELSRQVRSEKNRAIALGHRAIIFLR